jgi:hypothetical protein
MKRLLVALSLLIAAAPLEAQCNTSGISGSGTTRSCNFTISAPNPTSYTNPMLLDLTVSTGTSSATMTQADYLAGRSPSMAMTLSVRGNRTWAVTASGPATWTGTGPEARANKPVSDLRWSLTPNGSGTPLAVAPATVFTGDAGELVSRTLYWFTQLSWTGDPPGQYAIEVTLTLTAP